MNRVSRSRFDSRARKDRSHELGGSGTREGGVEGVRVKYILWRQSHQKDLGRPSGVLENYQNRLTVYFRFEESDQESRDDDSNLCCFFDCVFGGPFSM